MSILYSVKKLGKNIVVESQNANAKQVFFGWGSDRNAVDGSFYGREVRNAWGPNHEPRWQWVLTPAAVETMLDNLHVQLTDPAYKDRELERAARELQRKLMAHSDRERIARIAAPHGRCNKFGVCVEHAQDPEIEPCR